MESFLDYYTSINDLVEEFGKSAKNQTKLLRTIIYQQSMVKQIYELIYISFLSDEKDIFYADENSPEWKRFLEWYQEYDPFPKDRQVVKSYCKFWEWVILGNATMSKGFKQGTNLNKLIETGKSAFSFFVNKSKRTDEYMTYISNPDIKLAKRMINFFDNKYIVSAYQLNLSNVFMNEVIFIPKLAPTINMEMIKYLYSDEAIQKLKEIESYPSQLNCYDTSEEAKQLSMFYRLIEPDTEKYVQVRILSHVGLPNNLSQNKWNKVISESVPETPQHARAMVDNLNHDIEENLNAIPKSLKGFKLEEVRAVTKVVIHIHGGGFITMSSGSHQVYTRTWANRLNCPIFSIDYRLSPEHKYPAAIDDVWQVYVWMVKYAFIQLGILPEKIVLVGDSAGGNLVAAITMLAIQHGFRKPDEIIMWYPALSMDKNFVFPSCLYALIDPILSTNFLSICLEAYLNDDCEPDKDHYLTTFLADDEIIKRFPPTKVVVGSLDPLRDMSYRFVQKMVENNANVKLVEFTDFPHGFLSYWLPVIGFTEAKIPLDVIRTMILEV